MIETEIKIDDQELNGSYEDACRMLAKTLGSESNHSLDAIVELLQEHDGQLAENKISDEKKRQLLKAIWEYKIQCNKNDAENRIANTLNLFIKDIYKDSFHFFLELIQNADDASKGGQEHNLSITLDKNYNIIFEYDERGFNFSDIFSLTSLGNSTKKAQLDDDADIGEKGIGFKSIFAIVQEIDIKSKYFSFSIKANSKKLTTILEPAAVTLETSSNTILTLTLKDELRNDENFFNKIHEWMENNLMCEEFANPFLFLKNIRSITYLNEKLSDKVMEIRIEKTRIGIDAQFTHATIGDKEYIIYTRNMKFEKKSIISRWGHLENALISKPDNFVINRPTQVAFPLTDTSTSIKGKVYSYLPTTIEIDFPVFINLDVHLTASRGNISTDDFAENSNWNNQVQRNLPQFLLNAYLEIIATHTNDFQNNEFLKRLRETLYRYIPIQNQSSFYDAELNKFKDEIKNEAIILTNEDTFAKLNDIRYISSSLKQLEYDENRLRSMYQFIDSTQIDSAFPKTIEWNKLAYDLTPDLRSKYDAYDIVRAQQGIKQYWDNHNDAKVLEIIIEMLNEGISTRKCDEDVALIPLECKENSSGFDLVSYNSLEKALFLHSKDRNIEDHKDSVYLYENEDEIRGLRELVVGTYDIQEYDLQRYFRKMAKELEEEITNEDDVTKFIRYTFRFYENDPKCFNIADSPEKIKKFFCKYTLSGEGWKRYTGDKVNQDYVQALTNLKELKEWKIPQDVANQAKYIEYLLFLGIKHKIEFVDNDLDSISYEVLERWEKENGDKEILLDETTRRLTVQHPIQKYFLTQLNANVDKLFKENLKNLCEKLCLFKLEKKEYKYNKKEIIILEQKYIEDLNRKIHDSKIKNKETHSLKDSGLCIISDEMFPGIWGKVSRISTIDEGVLTTTNWQDINYEKNVTVESKFINSFNRSGEEFLKALRMYKMFNEYFGCNYAWGYGKNPEPLTLKLEQFLSCYKELSEDKLGGLMKAGYKIDLDGCVNGKDYYRDFEDLEAFLKSIEISSVKSKEDVRVIDLSLFSIVKNELMKDLIIFDKNNNKTENIKYLLKQEEKYSVLMINIIKASNVKLESYQEMEIRDYFGEMLYKVDSPKELSKEGYSLYCSGVFFDFHEENIEEGKNQLKSVWDKRILQQLCVPFILTDQAEMEGYGYICPICGEKSSSALSGMKFNRFKQHHSYSHPYLHIVSCLDCNSMLKYAKSLEIQSFDEVMKDFQTCYCIDNNHIKNHSAMMTVTLKIKTWDGKIKFLPMKMSYLNMILYDKLSKSIVIT